MIAAALDAARLLVGFALGYATARGADPCPVCGQPAATITGLCARCAPVLPTKERKPDD